MYVSETLPIPRQDSVW